MNYKSIVSTSAQAIYSIIQLHNKGQAITLDPMYNIGSMYNDLDPALRPFSRFDLYPRGQGVSKQDARNLTIPSSNIDSIILDPPWMIAGDSPNTMAERYTSFKTKEELMEFLRQILSEAYRVLITDGLLVVKCQEFTHNRRKFFMPLFVCNSALKLGFNPIDNIIIHVTNRMRSNVQKADHSHSSHSYHSQFLVFRKKRARTPYL